MTAAPPPPASAASGFDESLPAVQLVFESLAALFRPFLTVAETRFLFDDCSENHVVGMIECGRIRALNLATSVTTRRSLRVYRHSVERIVIPRLRAVRGEPPVESFLPHMRPSFLRREVAQMFGADERHIANLQAGGVLTGPRLSVREQAIGRTMPRIDRASLVEFIRAREVLA